MTPVTPDTTAATLARHTLEHPDGRKLHVYGELHGALPDEEPPATPADGVALHQRCDLLTGEWVAISPARNQRPQTGADVPAAPTSDAGCPLCPGGPEVPFAYRAAVFDNRFPSFMSQPPAPLAGDLVAPSLGRCEVVLYTDGHVGSLATLSPEQVATVVAVWCDRSTQLWADPRNAFVLIFENRGEAVGATLSHPHGQIYAFDRVPPLIRSKLGVLADHRDRHRSCLTCQVVGRDTAAAERTVVDSDSFTVSVPFAARWPYEVHVRARRHGARRLADLHPHEQLDLAAALQEVVLRYDALFGFELPYMLVAQEAPSDPDGQPWDDWHLAFEFLPPHRSPTKLKVRASVETSTGLFINDTLPEASAAALKATAVATNSWDGVAVPAITTSPAPTGPAAHASEEQK
jgi:UDPglucose--hexose-1-phosphate uridylyltransferase